jgi:hypothetical protein
MGLDVYSSGSELRPVADLGIRGVDASDSETPESVSTVDADYQIV